MSITEDKAKSPEMNESDKDKSEDDRDLVNFESDSSVEGATAQIPTKPLQPQPSVRPKVHRRRFSDTEIEFNIDPLGTPVKEETHDKLAFPDLRPDTNEYLKADIKSLTFENEKLKELLQDCNKATEEMADRYENELNSERKQVEKFKNLASMTSEELTNLHELIGQLEIRMDEKTSSQNQRVAHLTEMAAKLNNELSSVNKKLEQKPDVAPKQNNSRLYMVSDLEIAT